METLRNALGLIVIICITDLKDNSLKGRWDSVAAPGTAGRSAGLTFLSSSLREAPSVRRDQTVKKAKEKRVRKKHKNMSSSS